MAIYALESQEAIQLALTYRQTEIKENASLYAWGSVVHSSEYAPSVQGFVRGEVIITPVVISLVLLGSRVVPPDMSLAAVLLMVLPIPLGLGNWIVLSRRLA